LSERKAKSSWAHEHGGGEKSGGVISQKTLRKCHSPQQMKGKMWEREWKDGQQEERFGKRRPPKKVWKGSSHGAKGLIRKRSLAGNANRVNGKKKR